MSPMMSFFHIFALFEEVTPIKLYIKIISRQLQIFRDFALST